jgi:hypothetical protein
MQMNNDWLLALLDVPFHIANVRRVAMSQTMPASSAFSCARTAKGGVASWRANGTIGELSYVVKNKFKHFIIVAIIYVIITIRLLTVDTEARKPGRSESVLGNRAGVGSAACMRQSEETGSSLDRLILTLGS